MNTTLPITAKEAVEKLLSGNKQYIDSKYGAGDISKEKKKTGNPENYIKFITDEIRLAIGDETDAAKACERNVARSIRIIEDSLEIHHMEEDTGLRVMGAIYDIESGEVRFL